MRYRKKENMSAAILNLGMPLRSTIQARTATLNPTKVGAQSAAAAKKKRHKPE